MKLADFQVAPPEKEPRVSLAHRPARIMGVDAIQQDTFAALPDWVSRSSKFSAAEKCCFAVIYAEIKKESQRTGRISYFIAQYTLARRLGVNERTVRRHVAALRDGGLIGVLDNRSKGRPNEYYILHNDLRSKPEKGDQNGCPEGGVAPTEQGYSSGQPRPVVTPDLRTAASSSEKKKKNRDQKKKKLSFGEWEGGSPGSPPIPQAHRTPKPPEQAVEKSSARDALCQPTCEDETYMGFDDPVDDDSRLARARRSFSKAKVTAETDVAGDLAKKHQKRVERIERKGAAGQWGEGILSLESKWRDLVARGGYASIVWGAKEKRMAGDLLKRFSFDELCDAIEFSVGNWDRLFPKLVGPKRAIEAPTWAFFHTFFDRIYPISVPWAAHKTTWKKIQTWKAKADEYDIMPDDLSDLLDAANEALAKVGFKI